MPSPMSIESRSLLRLLEDGQWHDLEDIQSRLAATIAPGKALRRYEERVALRAVKEGPRKAPELSDEEKIYSGQRVLASVAINSMKKRYVEIAETDAGRRIRRRPGVDVSLPPKLDTGDGDPPELMAPEAFDGVIRSLDEVPAAAVAEDAAPDSPSTLETDPPDGSCPICGLYVVNHAQHEEFHATRGGAGSPEDAATAVAFFSEVQVRAIVADEVDKALDGFQKGMQTWLIHRFAALEALLQGLPRSADRGPGKGPVGFERYPTRARW